MHMFTKTMSSMTSVLRSLSFAALLAIGLPKGSAQILCIECTEQNAPVNVGYPNLLINGGLELGTCAGLGGYYCPNSLNYSCDIANWICTGGGLDTYAQTVDASWTTVPQGLYCAYLGNFYTEACSPVVNDTSCLVYSGCEVTGIPAGYPFNNSGNYGGGVGVSLEQSVSGLTVGATYVLEFWAGGEDFGSFPERGVFGVDIGFGYNYLICHGTTPGTIGTRYEITFLANSTTHLIKFTNWGHISSISSELILDDIQLFQTGSAAAAFTLIQTPCSTTIQTNNQSTGTAGSFLWDMGDGTQYTDTNVTHTYATSGTYTVTLVTNGGGCVGPDTATQTINLSALGGVTAAGTASVTQGCAPVNIDFFNTSNGTSWQWDFGDGSPVSTLYEPSYVYNTPGSYTVTLIAFDPGSCNLSDTITIPIVIGSGQPLDAFFLWNIGPDCLLPQISTTNISIGNPISYVWDMGDGTFYTDTNVVHTYAAPGFYFVELMVYDASGCSTPDSVTVLVNVPPPQLVDAAFTLNAVQTCTGTAVSTTNLSTGPAPQPEWDMGDGIVYVMPFVPYHLYPNPGTYTITLIVNDPVACNGSDTTSMVIQVDSLLPMNAGFTLATVPDCNQLVVQSNNTSTGSYMQFAWDMGDGTQYTDTNVTHTYNITGTYTVQLIVTDSLGCNPPDTVTTQVTYTAPPPVVAAFTVSQVIDCSLNSVQTVNQSTGTTMSFAWDMGDGTTYGNVPDVLHNYAVQGTYNIQLIVSDVNGCVPNDTIVVPITIAPPLVLDAAFTVAQEPDCDELKVDCINMSTGPAPSYSWDMGDGTLYTSTDVVDHVYALPGTYTITLIATDTLSCNGADTTSLQVTLAPYAPVVAAFNPVQVIDCGQLIIDATNTSTGSFMAFAWDMGDGTQYADTNVSHTYTAPGTYDVQLIVSDIAGCSPNDTASITVVVDPLTPVVSDFTISQVGSCALLTVQGINQSTGDSIAFTWDMGDGNTYATTNVTHQYAVPGVYTVELLVEDLACGNDSTYSVTVTVINALPLVLTTTGAICPDSTTTLFATGVTGGATYLWNNGSTGDSLVVSVAGTYWVTASTGLCLGSDTVDIVEADDLDLSYGFDACPGAPITLTIPYQGTAYLWENGDEQQSLYLLFPGLDTTDYDFQVWDSYGCVHQDSVTVTPMDSLPQLFAPNAFTPDGDGINDEFVITGYGEEKIELLIFNRWGEQIFKSTSLTDTWNGSFNGQIKQDVYVYKLRYNGECAHEDVGMIGHVTVLK
jgi:gliding motility-associated-like protein